LKQIFTFFNCQIRNRFFLIYWLFEYSLRFLSLICFTFIFLHLANLLIIWLKGLLRLIEIPFKFWKILLKSLWKLLRLWLISLLGLICIRPLIILFIRINFLKWLHLFSLLFKLEVAWLISILWSFYIFIIILFYFLIRTFLLLPLCFFIYILNLILIFILIFIECLELLSE